MNSMLHSIFHTQKLTNSILSNFKMLIHVVLCYFIVAGSVSHTFGFEVISNTLVVIGMGQLIDGQSDDLLLGDAHIISHAL